MWILNEAMSRQIAKETKPNLTRKRPPNRGDRAPAVPSTDEHVEPELQPAQGIQAQPQRWQLYTGWTGYNHSGRWRAGNWQNSGTEGGQAQEQGQSR